MTKFFIRLEDQILFSNLWTIRNTVKYKSSHYGIYVVFRIDDESIKILSDFQIRPTTDQWKEYKAVRRDFKNAVSFFRWLANLNRKSQRLRQTGKDSV